MKRYVLSLLLLIPFLMASQCTNAPGRYQLFMLPVGSPFLRPSEGDNPVQFLHRLDTATGRIQLFKFEEEFTKEEPYVEGPKTKACMEKLAVERIKNKKAIPGGLRTPEQIAAESQPASPQGKPEPTQDDFERKWGVGKYRDEFDRKVAESQQAQTCRALDSTGGEPSRPAGRYVMVEVPVVEKE